MTYENILVETRGKAGLVSFRLADRRWSQAVELVGEGGRGG
jgi:hypothetical protein